MEHNNDDMDKAKKLVDEAFGTEYTQDDHPLSFIKEPKFRSLVHSLSDIYEDNNCSTREVLCSIVEILMRTTEYKSNEPRTAAIAARAAPIIRQLLFENKQAPEIMVVISAMLTSLALYAVDDN